MQFHRRVGPTRHYKRQYNGIEESSLFPLTWPVPFAEQRLTLSVYLCTLRADGLSGGEIAYCDPVLLSAGNFIIQSRIPYISHRINALTLNNIVKC